MVADLLAYPHHSSDVMSSNGCGVSLWSLQVLTVAALVFSSFLRNSQNVHGGLVEHSKLSAGVNVIDCLSACALQLTGDRFRVHPTSHPMLGLGATTTLVRLSAMAGRYD